MGLKQSFLNFILITSALTAVGKCFWPELPVCAAGKHSSSVAKSGVSTHGWILRQTRGTAQLTTYVCPQGIKSGPDELGDYYVSRGPKWILYKYNEQKRVYSVITPQAMKAKKQSGALPLKSPISDATIPPKFVAMLGAQEYQKSGSKWVAGCPATLYVSPRGRDRSEILVASDIAMPSRGNEIADFIYATPVGIAAANRILLRREVVEKRGNRRMFMDTTLVKPADFQLSDFDPPRRYRLGEI